MTMTTTKLETKPEISAGTPAAVLADTASNTTSNPTSNPTSNTTSTTRTFRSRQMYVMQEALAREHMRHREHQARSARLSSELSSALIWEYLAARARLAADRHAGRAAVAAARPE